MTSTVQENQEDYFELEEVDLQSVFNKKVMILADETSHEDTLGDLAVISIIERMPYLYGTIFTQNEKIQDFYRRYVENNPDSVKIRESYLYRRYTFLINKKIFKDNTYILLDNYQYSQQQYNNLIDSITKHNLLCMFMYPSIVVDDRLKFDYFFITSYLDKSSILSIFVNYVQKWEYFKSFEDFYELIVECNDQGVVIVVEIKYKKVLCYDPSTGSD